jgi:hypothetical protein
MNLDNHTFDQHQEYSDGKYSVHSFSGEKGNFRRLSCSQESICVLPFDLNAHRQIRNVYLTKYKDYLTNSHEVNCISKTFDANQFDTQYLAVEDCIKNELGISNFNIDDLYYLGQIKHSLPFSKEYKCYALNLTPHIQDESGWKSPFSEDEIKERLKHIEKIKFNRILKGEVTDTLTLSCSLLLLSYFSD